MIPYYSLHQLMSSCDSSPPSSQLVLKLISWLGLLKINHYRLHCHHKGMDQPPWYTTSCSGDLGPGPNCSSKLKRRPWARRVTISAWASVRRWRPAHAAATPPGDGRAGTGRRQSPEADHYRLSRLVLELGVPSLPSVHRCTPNTLPPGEKLATTSPHRVWGALEAGIEYPMYIT
jgi:hypothetical protein